MFENKIHIKEIQSVVYVIPPECFKKRMYYGPNIERYELVYKITGESFTTYDGKKMHNLPGTVEFLPKKYNIDYYVDRVKPGDCIDIFFDTDYPMPEEAFVINTASNKKLKDLFTKIYNTWISKQNGYYYKCMAMFYEIISEISSPDGNYIPKDKFKKIEKGIEYLHNHCFDKNIDYYMPAKESGISYTYFKKLFISKFSATPIQYVTKLRMERSVELLQTNLYTISEIAEICGYENVYYFSKKFKNFYGVSPKNFKGDVALNKG